VARGSGSVGAEGLRTDEIGHLADLVAQFPPT
jgi:hypothetical protein